MYIYRYIYIYIYTYIYSATSKQFLSIPSSNSEQIVQRYPKSHYVGGLNIRK